MQLTTGFWDGGRFYQRILNDDGRGTGYFLDATASDNFSCARRKALLNSVAIGRTTFADHPLTFRPIAEVLQ